MTNRMMGAGVWMMAVGLAGCAGHRATATAGATAGAGKTFTNPITRGAAADPWVVRYRGNYYLTATLDPDGGVWVWKAATLTGIDQGEKVKVWTAPKSGPGSRMIWAPEMHRFGGRWYMYFTASDGVDRQHREYVLESAGDDPMGPYVERGRVDPGLERFAIDGTVLRGPGGKLYFVYSSGKLEIAAMESPARVDEGTARRAVILKASEPWEGGWVEAPEALYHGGRTFLVYSAGNSATPNYALGLMELVGKDPCDPSAWKKWPGPVFAPYFGRDGAVYTVGHNGFTTSPDGREDWIVYHGKDWRDERLGGFAGRVARAQKFTWGADGLPVFGHPVPGGVRLAVPSGE